MATTALIGGGPPVNRLWHCGTWRRDDNPLRRAVDRAERTALTIAIAAFVTVWVLVAVFAGNAAYAAGLRQQQSEHGWHLVRATLTESAAQSAESSPEWAAWTPATWRLPGGQQHRGLVATELNAQAGQQVGIWINAAGQVTRAPLTSADIEDQMAFAVLSVTMVLGVLLSVTVISVRLLFDRRRMAGWQRAWDAVGPLWSRR
jgi:uncharacterized membrane protein